MELYRTVVLLLISVIFCCAARSNGRSDERDFFRRMRNIAQKKPRLCETTADSVAVVAGNIHTAWLNVTKENGQEVIDRLMGGNSFTDIMCSLEGVSTLRELKSKMDDLGLTRNLFQFGYLTRAGFIKMRRYYTLQALDGQEDVQWCHSLTVCQIFDRVYSTIEASGLTDLDPEGLAWIMRESALTQWYKDYEKTDEKNTECRPLQKWMFLVDTVSELSSMDILWLDLPPVLLLDGPNISPLLCDILKAGQSGGVDGLFNLYDVRLGYTMDWLLYAYQYMQSSVTSVNSLDPAHLPHPDIEYLIDMFSNLRTMGLLDLQIQ